MELQHPHRVAPVRGGARTYLRAAVAVLMGAAATLAAIVPASAERSSAPCVASGPAEAAVTTEVLGPVTGRVWTDADSDGQQDEDEAGLGAVIVALLVDRNGTGACDTIVVTTTTGPDGRYTFPDVEPGAHLVRALGLDDKDDKDDLWLPSDLALVVDDEDDQVTTTTSAPTTTSTSTTSTTSTTVAPATTTTSEPKVGGVAVRRQDVVGADGVGELVAVESTGQLPVTGGPTVLIVALALLALGGGLYVLGLRRLLGLRRRA